MSSNFGRAPKVPSLFGWEELSPLRVLVSDICQLSKDCRLWVGNPPDSILLLELRYRPWWASSVSPSPGSVCEVQTFRFALYLCLSELCGIPHLLLVKPSSLDQVLPMLPWTATSIRYFTGSKDINWKDAPSAVESVPPIALCMSIEFY